MKNNILSILQTFQSKNAVSSSDFIVGGSACGVYTDCLTIDTLSDVDIYVLNNVRCRHCPGTDLLARMLYLPDWKDRLLEKDGFYFLSPLDLLVQETAGALLKQKSSTINNVMQLLSYLNMTVDEYIPILDTALAINTERKKDVMVANKSLLYEWEAARDSKTEL